MPGVSFQGGTTKIKLSGGPASIFNTLVPPLLALAGLPKVGDLVPTSGLLPLSDLEMTYIVGSVLAAMGKRGPRGLLLSDLHQQFKTHSEALRLLARYSIESSVLITPVIAPSPQDKHQRYHRLLEKWFKLRNQNVSGEITENDLDQLTRILQELLESAEEAYYPGMTHLISLVQEAQKQPELTWQAAWQTYLTHQVVTKSYLLFQEAVLLWLILFPDAKSVEGLVSFLGKHMASVDREVRHSVQCFLVSLSCYLQDLLGTPQFLLDMKIPKNDQLQRDPQDSSIRLGRRFKRYVDQQLDRLTLLDMQEVFNSRDLRGLYYIQYPFTMANLDLREPDELLDLTIMMARTRNRTARILVKLATLLLTRDTSETVLESLSLLPPLDQAERLDLLQILLGRILQIHLVDERGSQIEEELQQIALIACRDFTALDTEESTIRETVLRSLPTRSAKEVKLIVQLAEETSSTQIHHALAHAIQYSLPQTPEAWEALTSLTHSSIEMISEAAAKRLEQKGKTK